MKKLILIAGLILISQYSFPQIKSIKDKSPESSFWSIGFSGGVPLKILDKVNPRYNSHAGYIWGVNLFINIDRNNAIGAEFNYGRFVSNSDNNYNKFFEITFGPKFHLGSNFYASVQLGNYFMVYKHKYEYRYFYSYNQSESNPGFGLSLGLEKNIRINDDINLNLNEKLSLGLPGMEPVFYGMLRAGITFNENTHPVETHNQSDKVHSISLSGGFTSTNEVDNFDYDFTPNISIEGTFKTSPNIEMFGNITYNKISSDYGYTSIAYASMTETTVGSRFFIGSRDYSGFLQLGGGLYYSYFRPQGYYGSSEMYWGLNSGTGAKIKVYRDFSVIFTGRFHFIIYGNARPGEYFSTSCGMRYEI